jgi:hypothetical protein
VLLATLLTASPAVAAEGQPTPSPSAKELWQTYPLEASPEPARRTNARASATPAMTPDGPIESGAGVSLIGPLFVIVALLVASLVLYNELYRSPARAARARENRGAPLPGPTVTVGSPEPAPEPATAAPVAIRPPDPSLGWTAEIGWAEQAGAPHFHVLATHAGRPAVTLAESGPVPWPPSDAESIREVSEAAETLSAALAAGGWQELSPGDAWYARRFAWDPSVPGRRFERQRGGPEEASGLGDAPPSEPAERHTSEITEAP